jgi:UDP-N-acetylglucosamine--N-acetylmuramyl-(pentapeptide) pyrophosphoryl-undecaprenol N-acetylglucosamine transferase
MRILMVGGGSAGHVLPALPLIRALREQGSEVLFVGTHSGAEVGWLVGSGIDCVAISAGKLRRYFSWQNFTDIGRTLRGIVQAYRLIGQYRPQVVFSKGGFVSFPVVFAAWLRRVPVVAHESDLTPGLANRLVLPFVKTLCLSFISTPVRHRRVRVVYTGNPVRSEILSGDKQRGRSRLGFDGQKPVLVVTGGSLGADALNEAVRAALPQLGRRFDILHVCGRGKTDQSSNPGYVQREFIDKHWGDMLAAADVVLSRAGANAFFELLALHKPHLLVPLAAKVSRGDQLANAEYGEKHGFSAVLQEQDLAPETLVEALDRVLAAQLQYVSVMAQSATNDATALLLDELNRWSG